MNKFITKLAKLTLGLAMACGVGVAVGSRNKFSRSVHADGPITFNVTSTSGGTLTGGPSDVTYTYSSTYSTKEQLTGGNSMTLTLSTTNSDGYTVTGVTLNLKTNKSKGGGSATVNVGSTEIGSYSIPVLGSSYSIKTVNLSDTTKAFKSGTNLVIVVSASANSVYCNQFNITYSPVGGGGGSSVAAQSVEISLGSESSSTLESKAITLEKDSGSSSIYTEDLVATVTPNNATDKTVTWSVSGTNESYVDLENATIDDANNEIIFDIDTSATGTFVITASADGGTNVTDSITYTIVDGSSGGSDEYEKADSISIGDQVLLVYETSQYELSGISSTSTKYGIGVHYTTEPSGAFVLDVVAGNSENSISFKHETKYLTWTSGNSLNVTTELSDNSSWTVNFSNGNAVIANVQDSSRVIKWNNNSGQERFACYTSGQQAIQIYKKTVDLGDLTGISVETAPNKVEYEENEYFDPTGLVITRTYENGSNTYEYANHESEFTFSPALDVKLKTTDNSVSISYGGQSISQVITVKQGAIYTSVVVTGGSITSGAKGEATVSCSAVVNGTGNPDQTVLWYITSTSTYDTQTTVSGVATINNVTGVVTFLDNGSVYVWAYSQKGDIHNAETATASASNLVERKGSEANPYTSTEAVAAVLEYGSSSASAETYYAFGYIKKISGKNLWIVDDPDLIGASNEPADTDCLQCYASSNWTNVAVGDKVTVSGKMQVYSNKAEFSSSAVTNRIEETITISKTLSSDTLIVNSSFTYNGVVSINYTHKTDVANANSIVTFSGYNLSTVGQQEVTISYNDVALNKDASTSYTLTVEYASVSSVALNHHSITVEPNSDTNFTVTLNPNVSPSSSASFTVENDEGSSLDLSKYTIVSIGNLSAELRSRGESTESGILVVTATVGNISDSCIVTVTGDPYVMFDKESVHGIKGSTIDNTVTVSAVGITPNSWSWSVTSGSNVVSTTTGSATTTLTFKAAGEATIHVVVSDGNENAEGDVSVYVIDSLNSVSIPGGTVEHDDTIDTTAQGFANGAEVSSINGNNFNVSFNVGSGTNAPKYYSNNVSVPAVRLYGGGTMTVSSAEIITRIELVFGSGDGSNALTTDVGTYSDGSWSGSSSNVVFTVGGTSGNRRISTITIYWETTEEDVPVSNINYNAQKAILDFASEFTSMLNNVCDQDTGNTPLSGDSGLVKRWGDTQTAFTNFRNTLSTSADLGELSEREVFDALIANAGNNQGGDALEKALSSYDYVYGKYHAALDSGVAGSADFLHNMSDRNPVSYSPQISPFINILNGKENTNTIAIIVIISMVSMTAIGGYFFIRKRKENQ